MEREEINKLLTKLYYNISEGESLGSAEKLFRNAKKIKPKITRRQVQEWLSTQDVYTLHKPARKRFKRNRVMVGGIDQIWEMDLVDLQSIKKYNNNFKYILTAIDCFSKFAWAQPLKDKTGNSIVEAVKEIFKSGRKPLKLHTDQGKEFTNRLFQKFLKDNNISFFTTFNAQTKGSIIERYNRTLKTKMWKYFTWKNTLKYVDVLPKLLQSYNNSFHRSIKTKPVLVSKANESKVWHTLYDEKPSKVVFKFKVGEQVRISKAKRTFEKGYLPSWTTEIFTISERLPRNPPVYKLKEFDGEELEGTFYEKELVRVVKKADDLYKIEKILGKRKRGKHVEYLVKWVGYPEKYNSYVSSKDLNKV